MNFVKLIKFILVYKVPPSQIIEFRWEYGVLDSCETWLFGTFKQCIYKLLQPSYRPGRVGSVSVLHMSGRCCSLKSAIAVRRAACERAALDNSSKRLRCVRNIAVQRSSNIPTLVAHPHASKRPISWMSTHPCRATSPIAAPMLLMALQGGKSDRATCWCKWLHEGCRIVCDPSVA